MDCPVCEIWPVLAGATRCRNCQRYWERNGRERPHVLIERDRRKAYHAHQGAVWDKVGSKIVVQPSGCWGWTGKTEQVRINGQAYSLKRLLYQVLRGQLLDGARLERMCSTGGCVNPDHQRTRISS